MNEITFVHPVTIFSNRIYYKDHKELDEFKELFERKAFLYSSCYLEAYNMLFDKAVHYDKYLNKYNEELSDYLNLKNNNPELCVYELNSALNLAKGTLKAQQSNRKNSLSNKKEQIKSIENKIKQTLKKLNNYLKLRDNYLAFRNMKSSEFKIYPFKNIKLYKNKVIVNAGHKSKKELGFYEFEYFYLNKKVNELKHRIVNLEDRKARLLTRSDIVQHVHKKTQFKNRYGRYIISGRTDGKYKNFIFKCIHLKDDEFEIEIKDFDHKFIVKFPYDHEYLIKALSSDYECPIQFGLSVKKNFAGDEYLQFQASFDKTKLSENFSSRHDGVIGLDQNIDHLDICETDRSGNIIMIKTIKYDPLDSSSLSKVCKKVTEYSLRKGKQIIIEELSTKESKYKSLYRSKKLNRIYHNFNYKKFERELSYQCVKNNTSYKAVNPAMTSIIANLKYHNRNINSHLLASYVIARRGQGLKEKIPMKYKLQVQDYQTKSNWKLWSELNTLNKKLISKKYKDLPEWKLNRKFKTEVLI